MLRLCDFPDAQCDYSKHGEKDVVVDDGIDEVACADVCNPQHSGDIRICQQRNYIVGSGKYAAVQYILMQ